MPDFANPQDLNRYSYTRNSPLNFVDPSGHAVECTGGIGGCGFQPANTGVYDSVSARKAMETAGKVGQWFVIAGLTAFGADFVADGAEPVGHLASGNYGSAAISGLATAAPWIPGSVVRRIPGVSRLGSKLDEGLQSVKLYHGTSSVYEASIRAGINPPSGGRNFGGNQLGDGFYTTTTREGAEYFAKEAVANRIQEGLPSGAPIVLEIAVDMSEMTGIGVVRHLWWNTPQSLIDKFDFLEAPISGLEHWYQYKFNPSAYGNLEVLP